MEDLSPLDLKTIMHSKRANIYYLQHCRILVNGGRVEARFSLRMRTISTIFFFVTGG
jgi:hypothetical protein